MSLLVDIHYVFENNGIHDFTKDEVTTDVIS